MPLDRRRFEIGGGLYRVDIGAEKQEFPSESFLLATDHVPDLFDPVSAAGVFHAVGGNDKERMRGHIFRIGKFVKIADVLDGVADGVQKSGTALDTVLLSRHRRNVSRINPIQNYLTAIVEKHGGNQRRSLGIALLFHHGV